MRFGSSVRWNASFDEMTCSRPGDLRARMRPAAGRDQDVSRRARASPVATSRTVCASSSTARLLTISTLARSSVGGIGGFEPRDLAVLVGDQRRPVERRLGDRPAEAGGVLELVGEARGVDQELLRHAAADHAGAADAVFLGDHHARAVARRDARGAHAARARADDEQIDVVIRHRPSALRAGSRAAALRALWPLLLHFVAHLRRSLRRTACSPSPARTSCSRRRPSAARSSTSCRRRLVERKRCP